MPKIKDILRSFYYTRQKKTTLIWKKKQFLYASQQYVRNTLCYLHSNRLSLLSFLLLQFQLLDFAEKHDRERVEVTQKRQGLGKTELRVVQRKKNGRRALLSVYLPNINKQQQQQQQQSSNKHKKGEGISHRSHKNDDSGNNDEDDDDDDDHNYCTADQTTEQESQPDSSFKFSPQFPLREQNSA